MAQHRCRQFTAVLCIFLTIAPTILPGCGNTGELLTTPELLTAALDLSATQIGPGQFLTIRHDSIHAGSQLSVTFAGPQGNTVTAQTSYTDEGLAKIAVPALFDPATGQPIDGDVTVSVAGIGVEQTIHVNALKLLDGFAPGAVTVLVLQSCLDSYRESLDKLMAASTAYAGQMDASPAVDELTARIDGLQALITEIQQTGQLVLRYPDGHQEVITSEQLALTDRMLAALILGCLDEINTTLPSGQSAPATQGGGLSDPNNPAYPFVHNTPQMLRDAGHNWTATGKILGNGVGVVMGVAGLFTGATEIGIALGIGSAMIVAGTGALGNLLSYGSEAMARGFERADRPTYDAGKEALDTAKNIASSAVNPNLPKRVSDVNGVVSLAVNVKGVYDGFKSLKCMEATTSPSQQSVPGDDFCPGESTDTVTNSVGSSGTVTNTDGTTTGSGSTVYDGCWHIARVNDSESVLSDGLEVWTVQDGRLTDVWKYSTTGRIKQEFRDGPAIEVDGVVTDDMTSSVADQGSGRFVMSYSYNVYARLSDGSRVKVGGRSVTLTGQQGSTWNSGGYSESTGTISGTFSILDSVPYLHDGWGSSIESANGNFTGQPGTCPGSTFDPGIEISGPDALYLYRTNTLTASMPAVEEPIAWTWSYLGSLDKLPAENQRLSIAPQSVGELALWVTADVNGLRYYRVYEIPVTQVPVEVSISGPSTVHFSQIGETATYNAVLERGDPSRLTIVWSQFTGTVGQNLYELLNVEGMQTTVRILDMRSNTLYLTVHVSDPTDENIWNEAYLAVEVIYDPPPPPQ